MSYHANVTAATNSNDFFRHVINTGAKSQLVVMSIPPGGDIGAETHAHVEQSLFIVSGTGTSILDGVEEPLLPGDVLVVTPGVHHNVRNTGQVPLKLYTVYAPPNHLDGRVHKTQSDAAADTEDEAFGEANV
jgi:mannose-6-phosphate isomerase-like protein (cupin superfamily)